MSRTLPKRGAWLLIAVWLAVASAAWAEPKLEGTGVIWDKDAVQRTLTIGETSYEVGSDTVLRGRNGEPLGFASIPVAREENGRVFGLKDATVEFEAVAHGRRLRLRRLKLIDPPR
jgi:hypothetical protein